MFISLAEPVIMRKFIGHKILLSGTFLTTPPKRLGDNTKRTQLIELIQINRLKYEQIIQH
jgi:hypothetical protein